MTHTGLQSASCLSLMRLKPVVKTFPSARKMARMGLAPSCAFSFSWETHKEASHEQTAAALVEGAEPHTLESPTGFSLPSLGKETKRDTKG